MVSSWAAFQRLPSKQSHVLSEPMQASAVRLREQGTALPLLVRPSPILCCLPCLPCEHDGRGFAEETLASAHRPWTDLRTDLAEHLPGRGSKHSDTRGRSGRAGAALKAREAAQQGKRKGWAMEPGSNRKLSADNLDAVELKTSTNEEAIFGIGLQVGNDRHHRVQRIGALQDMRGAPITAVSVGDLLTHVEGQSTDVDGLQIAEDMILGKEGSVVSLTFKSGTNGRTFEVAARRHVKVRSWEQIASKFQVRQELAGQNLSADHTIVPLLEKVRSLISDSSGNPIDLMGGPGNRAELGLVLGKDSRDKNLGPLQIADLITCSPAAESRRIEKGDEIVSVDGVTATEGNVDSLLRLGHAVGSRAKLKLRRQGRAFEIELHRAVGGRFAAMGKILAAINAHQQALSHDADTTAAFETIKGMLMDFGRQRSAQEQTLARNLFEVQNKLLDGIESAFELFHAPGETEKAKPMPIDHLVARVQQLEMELAKSQEDGRSQAQSLMDLREKLRVAKEHVETAEVSKIRMQAELDDLKQDSVPRAEYDASRHDILDMQAQISRLQTWKDSSVPSTQLDAVQRDHHAQQQRLSGLTEQVAELKRELAKSEHFREEARIHKEKLEDMKVAMESMISKDALASSESARALLQKELGDVRSVMVSREEHDVILAERDQLRKELDAWKTKSNNMVSRSVLELAQEEEKQLQAQVDRLNKKLKLLVAREDYNAALQNISSLEDQNRLIVKKGKDVDAELAALKATVQSRFVSVLPVPLTLDQPTSESASTAMHAHVYACTGSKSLPRPSTRLRTLFCALQLGAPKGFRGYGGAISRNA